MAELAELGTAYRDDPGDVATNMDAWSMYMLWDAGRKAKMSPPADTGSIKASEWLDRSGAKAP